MKKFTFIPTAVTALSMLLLILLGCSITGEESGWQSGMIQIMLTDAPLNWDDVEKFNITIKDVQISTGEDAWQSLYVTAGEYDLLELQNGVYATLGIDTLLEGKYEQLRLVLDNGDPHKNELVFNDLSDQPVIIPSGIHTGIKITGPFEIVPGGLTKVKLDFDAESSIVELGTGDLILKPMIKVETEIVQGVALNINFFFDDFGVGSSDNDIPNWEEYEHPAGGYKCSVVEGSELGGRHARIYGGIYGYFEHYFLRRFDLSGFSGGSISFMVRRSANWDGYDRVLVELYYGGKWHTETFFAVWSTRTDFSRFELPLYKAMMDSEFRIRFKTLYMFDSTQYLDIDNFELVVK